MDSSTGYRNQVKMTIIVLAIFIIFSICYISRNKFATLKTNKVHMVQPPVPDNNLEHLCTLPPDGYKGWNQGVVTVMKPEISRNCPLLFLGDKNEVKKVQSENKAWNSSQYDKSFDEWAMSGDCEKIKSEFTKNLYTTKEELDFPLAFSINVHDHPQQIYRFLKVIYRPHNLYCLHVDQKADDRMKTITENIGKCLDNVLIPSRHVKVVYACYPIMEAQLVCMKELLKARSESYQWRYVITLCGRELPLRTNREIVHMLKRLNGTSGLPQHATAANELRYRFTKRFKIGPKDNCQRTNEDIGPVPHGIEIRKSVAYFSLTPKFVHFLFTNSVAIDLYEFMKRAGSPEEYYFSSLSWLKGVPGGYDERYNHMIPTVADIFWCFSKREQCNNLVVNSIGIVTSSELKFMKYKVDLGNIKGPLFHNKYYMEVDHTVMDCIEQQLIIRNIQEYESECKSES